MHACMHLASSHMLAFTHLTAIAGWCVIMILTNYKYIATYMIAILTDSDKYILCINYLITFNALTACLQVQLVVYH